MYIAILGRQPAISVAELERLYGARSVSWLSDRAAKITSDGFDFERLGGSQKAGKIITELPGARWPLLADKVIEHYREAWRDLDHKITLGISCYDLGTKPHDILTLGLALKKVAQKSGGSLRLIPNAEPALSTATSHHNKLGLAPNKLELLLVKTSNGRVILAESVGAQNITAIAARDQARPKTDAFVGMLPPKLARIMVNLTTADTPPSEHYRLLDPFCGTGVVLQEASLLGYQTYGSDLSEKMVDYSRINLNWLQQRYHHITAPLIEQGDATKYKWAQPVSAIVSESYLGQPFSAPPAPDKLIAVRDNCDHIISEFLANVSQQLPSGAVLCIAVPTWRDKLGLFTHLPLIGQIDKFGFQRIELEHARPDQLIYYRENQIVARELLLLVKL